MIIHSAGSSSVAEFNEKFIRRAGSPFALAQFQCELTRILERIKLSAATAQVVRYELRGNKAVTADYNFELTAMFQLRLYDLESKATEIKEAIDQCYRLDVPGDSPGTQENLLSLGYFEYTLEEAEGKIQRGDVRKGWREDATTP